MFAKDPHNKTPDEILCELRNVMKCDNPRLKGDLEAKVDGVAIALCETLRYLSRTS